MLRNREFFYLLLGIIVISVMTIFVLSFYSIQASIIAAIAFLLILCSIILFMKIRYKKMEQLSSYLRKISDGNFTLDVRDNEEGELSILKNELFKMTKILSENRQLLQEDKLHLMDAISDISHQLKTPLTSMTVMADLLEQDDLPQEKRKEFVHNIQIQLERIEWLVSSLLKISKIDAGAIHFKKDPIHLKQLLQEIIESFAIPLEVKQLEVSITGDEEIIFVGDRNWTQEALINLIKNCIEHSNENGVLSIHCDENSLYTEVKIRDNGNGIAKEDLPYIFNRFYKGKQASVGSVGIGLAIAHTIVSEQNGTINVDSDESGTEFQIKFYKQII